jgi:hypothetical protein
MNPGAARVPALHASPQDAAPRPASRRLMKAPSVDEARVE